MSSMAPTPGGAAGGVVVEHDREGQAVAAAVGGVAGQRVHLAQAARLGLHAALRGRALHAALERAVHARHGQALAEAAACGCASIAASRPAMPVRGHHVRRG